MMPDVSIPYDPPAVRAEILPLVATFLTVDDVAEALVADRGAVARWARKGSVPGAKKVVGEWRFHKAPFVAWARDWWDPETEPSFDRWFASLDPSSTPELQPPIVDN